MKLEPGMYVRTEYSIGRLKYFNEELEEWVNEEYNSYTEDFIVKASHNIIDLIEVGDYVNGEEVCGVYIYEGEKIVDVDRVIYKNKNIKSIVTKEQFSSMEYRLGE